ncbi:MAG: Uma2 family endonuclease [Acidobacteriaceae bacterium]|jgi:Uma2 family endonuclease
MRAGQIDLVDLELPIVLRPSAPVSDEDLLRFSVQNKPYKIELNKEGEIEIMTPVGYKGGKHEGYIAAALLLWAEKDGRGSALPANVGFKLPDGSCLAPDAAWLTKEHEDSLTPEQQDGFPPICPDFLIEVRSQSDARRIVEAKIQTWLDNGAQLAWLVDPVDGSVTIYRPGEAVETLLRPEVVVAGAPVAGFELRCARLWAAR